MHFSFFLHVKCTVSVKLQVIYGIAILRKDAELWGFLAVAKWAISAESPCTSKQREKWEELVAGISLFGKSKETGLSMGSQILESPVLKPWNRMVFITYKQSWRLPFRSQLPWEVKNKYLVLGTDIQHGI